MTETNDLLLPSYITLGGIEVLDSKQIPPGEIWLEAPLPDGGKVRYMFALNDYRMTLRANGGESFLDWIDNHCEQMRQHIEMHLTDTTLANLDQLQLALRDFKRGRDRKTAKD
jgi:hypothetical protein